MAAIAGRRESAKGEGKHSGHQVSSAARQITGVWHAQELFSVCEKIERHSPFASQLNSAFAPARKFCLFRSALIPIHMRSNVETPARRSRGTGAWRQRSDAEAPSPRRRCFIAMLALQFHTKIKFLLLLSPWRVFSVVI
jgi:hypothetical protein